MISGQRILQAPKTVREAIAIAQRQPAKIFEAARCNEHGAAPARSAEAGCGSRASCSGLRLVHRRLRHADLKEAKALLDELAI